MFLKLKTAKCILSIILFLCISLSFTVMAFADYVSLDYFSEPTSELSYDSSSLFGVTWANQDFSINTTTTSYIGYFYTVDNVSGYIYVRYYTGYGFDINFIDPDDLTYMLSFRYYNRGSGVQFYYKNDSTYQNRDNLSLSSQYGVEASIVTFNGEKYFKFRLTNNDFTTMVVSTSSSYDYNYTAYNTLSLEFDSDSVSNNFGDISFNVYALNSTDEGYNAYLSYTVNFTAYVNGGKFFLYVPNTVDNVDVDQSLGQYYSHETLKNLSPSEYGTKLGLYLFNEDGSYSKYENYYQWNDYFDTTNDGTLFAYNILVYEDIPAGDYSVTTSVRLPVVNGVSHVTVSQSTIIPLGGYYFIDDSTGVTDYGNSLNSALSSGAVSYETASEQLNTYINNYISTGSGDGSGSGAVSTEEASYLVAQQTLIQNQLLETYGSNQYDEHIEEYNENLQVIENANEEIKQHEEAINEMQEDARHNFEDALTGFDDYIESEERDSIFTAIYEGNGGMVVTMMVGALLFGLIGFILYGKKA